MAEKGLFRKKPGRSSGFLQRRTGPGPAVFVCARLLLGAVFIYASYDKMLHPQAFAHAVYNYQLLPDAAVNLTALVLPWLELMVGFCLVVGMWLPGASLLAALMMCAFTGALVFNEIRGLDVACGCFTTGDGQGPANLWTVIRDLFFLVVALYLVLHLLFSKKHAYR